MNPVTIIGIIVGIVLFTTILGGFAYKLREEQELLLKKQKEDDDKIRAKREQEIMDQESMDQERRDEERKREEEREDKEKEEVMDAQPLEDEIEVPDVEEEYNEGEKCNGYPENSSKSFKNKLKKWKEKKYFALDNTASKLPKILTSNPRARNENIYFGGIPDELKNSYIDNEGEWVYGCECGKDDTKNPFTNCKCNWGQYYDYKADECINFSESCSEISDLDSGDIGTFYNIMRPTCNIKGKGGLADSGNKGIKGCCLSCNYKAFTNYKSGGIWSGAVDNVDWYPAYIENDDKSGEIDNLVKSGEHPYNFNSRPVYFHPIWEKDSNGNKIRTAKESDRGILSTNEGGLSETACDIGDCQDDTWNMIKRNLFYCVRTSQHGGGTTRKGRGDWGHHPDWGSSGSIEEVNEGHNPKNFFYEDPGRQWIHKDKSGQSYNHEGYYANKDNNSAGQICNDKNPKTDGEGTWSQGEAGFQEASKRKTDCDKSSYWIEGKKYKCKGDIQSRMKAYKPSAAEIALGVVTLGGSVAATAIHEGVSRASGDRDKKEFRSTCERVTPSPNIKSNNQSAWAVTPYSPPWEAGDDANGSAIPVR